MIICFLAGERATNHSLFPRIDDLITVFCSEEILPVAFLRMEILWAYYYITRHNDQPEQIHLSISFSVD